MHKSRRSARLLLLLLVGLLAALGGCTRHFFRKRADKEVDALLQEKDRFPEWGLEQYHVYPDPRARFADEGHPDRPPMPPDDLATMELSPNPQKPGKKGPHYMEGVGYLDALAEWDALNRAETTKKKVKEKEPDPQRKKKKPAPAPSPYRDPLDSKSPPRPFRLKLEQAIELGLFNSREFQDRREDLYLTALPVTVERFAFSTQFFAMEQIIRERLGKDFPGGPANRWVANSTFGFSKLFSTGALLLFQFANRTVVEMANKTRPRVISESAIDFDLIQPLLQGGGRKVTLEPLTITERNFLYEIRDFARFRKQFFVALAAGADIGGTSIGATRFRNRPTSFDITQSVPGAQVQPGAGFQFGLPASGNAAASGFLPVVLNQTLLENERANIAKLEYFLQLFKAYQVADLLSQLQVDRVEQQLLQSRSSTYQRDQTYREALDRFKLQLGVPAKLPLELDNEPVAGQNEQLRRFNKIIEDYEEVREEASELDKRYDVEIMEGEPPFQPRKVFHELATTSELVKGTAFRSSFLVRWNKWVQTTPPKPELETDLLRKQLDSWVAERKKLEKQRDDDEDEKSDLDPADPTKRERLRELEQAIREAEKTIRELTLEIESLRFEVDLRGYEEILAAQAKVRAPRVARFAGTIASLSGPSLYEAYLILQHVPPDLRTLRLIRFNAVFDDFERGVLIEARNERLESVRKQWPELPRICVDGIDLMTGDIEQAETVVGRTAIGNRFDLMNTRAQLVDAWRQIAVAANSLLGTFNVEYHLDSLTPPGRDKPFAFDGSRSRHQLVFNGELPLVRILERNNYRASLIGWQRQRRTLMATEDTIVAGVRAQIRQLRVLAENYRIAQRAVELSYLQVENSLDVFRTPPLPGGTGIENPAALTQQLLEAQRNLINAQNQLVNIWVQYLTSRMQLYRDLELMPLDHRGTWTDDIATCHCPDPSPGRPGSPQRNDPDPEDAPPPRKVEPAQPTAARR